MGRRFALERLLRGSRIVRSEGNSSIRLCNGRNANHPCFLGSDIDLFIRV